MLPLSDPASGMDPAAMLRETLAGPARLALAYAPAAARPAWLALLALDARLAGVVGAAREPVLAQIRLAWWRERLAELPDKAPKGEPLLAALAAAWGAQAAALIPLVDGWEAMLGEAPLPGAALDEWVAGRGGACAAIAALLGAAAEPALRMGRGWALGDLAAFAGSTDEGGTVRAMIAAADWRAAWLPRAMRPLAILHGFAVRAARGRRLGPLALAGAVRRGILGF